MAGEADAPGGQGRAGEDGRRRGGATGAARTRQRGEGEPLAAGESTRISSAWRKGQVGNTGGPSPACLPVDRSRDRLLESGYVELAKEPGAGGGGGEGADGVRGEGLC